MNIPYNSIISAVGAQNTKHTIKYKYIRHSDVGGTNQEQIRYIY